MEPEKAENEIEKSRQRDLSGVRVCVFTSGLDEMKRRDQGSDKKVLAVLKECGRFSVFEATANRTIAGTVGRLQRKKFFKVDAKESHFPWTVVRITPEGERFLAEQ